MTWTYSGNPNKSKKDAIRHKLSLTDENHQLKTDEEIEYELSQENDNINQAAANIARSLAAHYAKKARRESGPIEQDYRDMTERYMKIAKDLEGQDSDSSSADAQLVASSDSRKDGQRDNSDRVKPFFTRNMHENN